VPNTEIVTKSDCDNDIQMVWSTAYNYKCRKMRTRKNSAKALRDMNRIPEKLRNMGWKVKKK
jgi:hypothetical protein